RGAGQSYAAGFAGCLFFLLFGAASFLWSGFLCRFFRCTLLRRRLLVWRCLCFWRLVPFSFRFRRFLLYWGRSGVLLWFGLRRSKALTIKGDLGDPHFSVRLTMSVNFLVLLLAFEMKNQNFVAAARFRDPAAHHDIGSRADLAIFRRQRQD